MGHRDRDILPQLAGVIDMASKDFLVEVAKGNVPGHSLVHKFGRNDGVPNGSWEMIWLLSVARTFLSNPTTVRIKAGGAAADTAAGNNAREVTVTGIDSTLVEASEAIATNGALASAATTTSFWRVYRAYVSEVGVYGNANAGNITIENSGGTQDLLRINLGEGQTEFAGYSVPTGKMAYLLSVHVTVDGLKPADFRMFQRQTFDDKITPQSPRLVRYWDGIADSFTYIPRSPETFQPLTDIWVEARGSGAATEVSADFELLLVDI